MNFPVAPQIPETLPQSVFLLVIFPPGSRSDSKRSPNAREQNRDRPRVRRGSLLFSLPGRGRRARPSRTPCAGTFVRVREELAHAPDSNRRHREERSEERRVGKESR